MALNVLEKRSSWRECPYLIFYIHNPEENSYKKVFQEFLYTLCFVEMTQGQKDYLPKELRAEFGVEEDLTIPQQVEALNFECQYRILDVTQFCKLLRLMGSLRKHTLLIIGQASINSQQEGKALHKIVDHFLTDTLDGCSFLAFSSQLPPQKYFRDRSFQGKINQLSGKFTEEEVDLDLQNNLSPIFWDSDSQTFSKPVNRIISVSESIPYELSRLCDCPFQAEIDSEDKVVALYYDVRKEELAASYSQAADLLRNGSWVEYLAQTFLGVPFKVRIEDDKNIDENLCSFENLGEGYYILKFHSQLYYEWALEYLMKDITEFIEGEGLNRVLKMPNVTTTPTIKGDLFEKYCILRLCYFACHPPPQNLWTFTSFKSDLTPDGLSISFRVANLLIFRVRPHTIGDCLQDHFEKPVPEETCPENIYPGTLFVPNAEDCKGLDQMIFMSPKQRKIFLIQCTVNVSTHSSSDVDLYAYFDGKIHFSKP